MGQHCTDGQHCQPKMANNDKFSQNMLICTTYLYFEHSIGTTATIIDDIMSVLSNQHLFKCGFHCSHFYSTLSETERSLMVPTYFATRQSQASKIYVYKNCIIIKTFIFPNLCFSPPASNLEPWNFKMN